MSEPFVERRRHPRVSLNVEARLRLLLPEQPFIPIPMHGYTRQVSLTGLRFETRQTPEDYYKVIIQKSRRARISILLPGADEEVILHGKVVWAVLNKEVSPPTCSYGFSFEKLGRTETDAVRRCVDWLLQRRIHGDA